MRSLRESGTSLALEAVQRAYAVLPLVALLLVPPAILSPSHRVACEATALMLVTVFLHPTFLLAVSIIFDRTMVAATPPESFRPGMFARVLPFGLLSKLTFHSARLVAGLIAVAWIGVVLYFFTLRLGVAAGIIWGIIVLLTVDVLAMLYAVMLGTALATIRLPVSSLTSGDAAKEEAVAKGGSWSRRHIGVVTILLALWVAGWTAQLAGAHVAPLLLIVAGTGIFVAGRVIFRGKGIFMLALPLVSVLVWLQAHRKQRTVAAYGLTYERAYAALYEELVAIDPFQRQYSHGGQEHDYQKKYEPNVVSILASARKAKLPTVEDLRHVIFHVLERDPYGNRWGDVGSEERYQQAAERLWEVLHADSGGQSSESAS